MVVPECAFGNLHCPGWCLFPSPFFFSNKWLQWSTLNSTCLWFLSGWHRRDVSVAKGSYMRSPTLVSCWRFSFAGASKERTGDFSLLAVILKDSTEKPGRCLNAPGGIQGGQLCPDASVKCLRSHVINIKVWTITNDFLPKRKVRLDIGFFLSLTLIILDFFISFYFNFTLSVIIYL